MELHVYRSGVMSGRFRSLACARTLARSGAALLAVAVLLGQPPQALAQNEHVLPLFISDSHQSLQGFIRIINRSDRAGTVRVHAVDDDGTRHGPIDVSIGANAVRHFNSTDLEDGNPDKGLSGGVGDGQGNWRLELDTDLDIEPLAYTRPLEDGFLTSVHEVTENAAMRWHVPIFNPGSNTTQQSWLRIVNTSGIDTEVVIDGLDDMAVPPPGGTVRFTLPADAARMLSAQALEQGYSQSVSDFEFDGSFGDGTGKWQLFVSAGRPIQAMSLLFSETGNLTNLSGVIRGGTTAVGAAQAQRVQSLARRTADAQRDDAAQPPPLVVFSAYASAKSTSGISAKAAAVLKSIQSNPAASEVWIGRSNPAAVVAAGALSLELPPTPAAAAEASTAIAFTGIDVDHGEEGMTSLYARDEDTDSEAGLVIQGLDVLGSIRHGDDVYKVLPLGDGLTAVYLHDDSQLRRHPEGWEELMHPQVTDAPPRESDGTPGTRSDTGSVVDVMVAYTSEAKVETGNIDLFVQFAMDNAHRTYRNSDINNPRLRLVHKLETSYSEDTHLLEHLNRVTYTADDPGPDGNYPDADGYMDDVQDVRDRYGADVVVLILPSSDELACGLAWAPTWRQHPDYDWSPFAFAVITVACETSDSYSFAHEIGHIQGADHDPDNASQPAFPYGHGVCNVEDNWHTVMAYFEKRSGSCTRQIPYFSTPTIEFGGTPIGDAAVRDNRRVLIETASRVASFRPSVTPPPPTTAHALPLVTPASNSDQQTFVRIINRSDRAGTVLIRAIDDNGRAFGPVSLAIDAGAARHFNSADFEAGNQEKGLSEGIGDGTGNWRLALVTELDIEPLAYIRTPDGFLTSIHDVAPETETGSMRYHVPIVNPGNNADQHSWLRVVNVSDAGTNVVIEGRDDTGAAPPGGQVRFTVPANAARMLSARELEEGYSQSGSDFEFDGSFGDGTGKWQLFVSADQPIQVMGLLFSASNHVTNLSRVQADDVIRGTAGGDQLYGGNRNDVFNPLDNGTSSDLDSDRGYDTVFGSRGDDTIIHTDSGPQSYQEVDYSELSASGIKATVDFTANIATVEKGSHGTDTILDVANPLNAAGFALIGTAFDDEFHLTVGDGQFANVESGAGDDTFQTELLGSGWLRVNYAHAPNGIDLDLDAGVANDDGFGDVDTFTGDIPPGVGCSEHSDVIRGSDREESFFCRQGDDDIDGGGGFDWLRFSYSSRFSAYVDVQDLEVDLDAGSATGTWNGSPFSYSIANIEGVWGGTGDDVIRGAMEQVRGSPGNDRIIFTDTSAYGALSYTHLPEGGITATLDGSTDQGTVDKGAYGTDTIEDFAGLWSWNGGGFGIRGSDSDDVINITMDAEQWMQVEGRAGDDTFNIQADLNAGGQVRLDYKQSRSGVTVDLADGLVHDDGFGGRDTINGNVWQVRGSDFLDLIVGSDNGEQFIGRQGDDTIDGRGGHDTLRFDRSCCATILGLGVSLYRNWATGLWDGQRFFYTIRNIEEVRGSDEDDFLEGDSGDNRLRGGGGVDTIEGFAGDDRLEGGSGSDQFRFGTGHGDDRIDDFTDGVDTMSVVLANLDGAALRGVLANAETLPDGRGVRIDFTSYGGGTIELRGFDPADLDENDF